MGKRRTFRLAAFEWSNNSKIYKSLPVELKAELASLNRQFLDNNLTSEQVVACLKDLIEKQDHSSAKQKSILSSTNMRIFDAFWAQVYGVRYLEDEKSARYDFLKAIRLIEPLSLQTATAAEFQNALKSNAPKVIRRATDRLNQILKWLKRDVRLNKPKVGLRVVSYVTYEEFQKILIHLDGHVKNLAISLYASGMRLSEALAVKPNDYFDGRIMIDKQLTKLEVLKPPKREKIGHSLVLPLGHEAIKAWVEVSDKNSYRYVISKELRAAAKKTFPNDKNKWVSPHDLRHSHAIHLLGMGATITQVALNLRNRVDVCQMYYTGFSHSSDTLDYLRKIIDTNKVTS